VRFLTVQVVHEPVEEWQKVPSGPNGKQTLNLLDKFYQDPQKYAYTFQNYVFMSRVMQVRHWSCQATPHLATGVHLQ
jgi:deoxyadenosine/deoxycytidine kinase